jgi:uncharacterized membrane protein YvbJ
MNDKEKYYPWVCPKCGDDSCSDPMRIVCTQCHNEHSVILSDYIKDNGDRVATLREELSKK